MLSVDVLTLHDQHRKAKLEHREWLEEIAAWREEHHRVRGILEAVKAAWDHTGVALEEHARHIQALTEHLNCHEQTLSNGGWAVDVLEDESMVADRQYFEIAQAEARKVHEEMQQLYASVAAEVFALLKLMHPDAVVLETN
jgi:hypothetical protein